MVNITPGPWSVEPSDDMLGHYYLSQAYIEQAAASESGEGWDTATQHDNNNAQLMAAAPELYAVCIEVFTVLENELPKCYTIGMARRLANAINKAGGEVGKI